MLDIKGVFIMAMLPFAMFLIIETAFTFVYAKFEVVVWAVACCLAGTSLLVVVLPLPSFTMYGELLSKLCFLSAVAGTAVGYYNYESNGRFERAYEGQRTYTDVTPSSSALAYWDAGKLFFSADSTVSSNKTIGYASASDGSLYCVAPIEETVSAPQSKADFFAVGVDCCEAHGDATCNDWDNPKAHAGLVYLRYLDTALLANFNKAAQMVGAAHSLSLPKDVLFVRWTEDPERVASAFQNDAISFFLFASAIALAVCIFFAFAAHTSISSVNTLIPYTEKPWKHKW
jgi:hypothetical protein